MKKLIAVSVALVLVAGSAFAQVDTTWGGIVWSGVNLARGDNNDDRDVSAGGLYGEARIWANLRAERDIGVFTGYVQVDGLFGALRGQPGAMQPEDGTGGPWINAFSAAPRLRGNSTFMTNNNMFWTGIGNWLFALNDINGLGIHRWGHGHFTREIQHRLPAITWFNASPLELLGSGMAFDVRPLGNNQVQIGAGVPMNWTFLSNNAPGTQTGQTSARDTYEAFYARVRVALDGIGWFAVSYSGANNLAPRGPRVDGFNDGDDLGDIYVAFRYTGMAGLQAHVAARVGLASDAEDMAVGLSATWADGGFGVNFRGTFGLGFGEWWDNAGNAMAFNVEVLPWFDITENVSAQLYGAFGMNMGGSDFDGDPQVMWMVHPYMHFNIGNPRLSVGFRMWGHNNRGVDAAANVATMGWEIPIGFAFQF